MSPYVWVIGVGLWGAVFGVWPLANPGHSDLSDLMVLADLMVHVASTVVVASLLARKLWEAERRWMEEQ